MSSEEEEEEDSLAESVADAKAMPSYVIREPGQTWLSELEQVRRHLRSLCVGTNLAPSEWGEPTPITPSSSDVGRLQASTLKLHPAPSGLAVAGAIPAQPLRRAVVLIGTDLDQPVERLAVSAHEVVIIASNCGVARWVRDSQQVSSLNLLGSYVPINTAPPFFVSSTSMVAVVADVGRREFVDKLILLDQAVVAEMLCQVNGWDRHSLNR